MKKLVLISIIVVFASFPFTILSAQYAIPSFDLELTGSSITFEEDHEPGIEVSERRKMFVARANPNNPSTVDTKIIIYQIGSPVQFGPYILEDETPFEFNIDDLEWGMKVIEYEIGTNISVWIE